MKVKSKASEMNTNYYSVLLGIFLVIMALILYKNITSPIKQEKLHESPSKQEENAVKTEEAGEKQTSDSAEKTH
jgi:hypothetical protein